MKGVLPTSLNFTQKLIKKCCTHVYKKILFITVLGPMAHLFHNVHEQNYVAHVMAYAARIGRYTEQHSFENSEGIPTVTVSRSLIIVLLLLSRVVSQLL